MNTLEFFKYIRIINIKDLIFFGSLGFLISLVMLVFEKYDIEFVDSDFIVNILFDNIPATTIFTFTYIYGFLLFLSIIVNIWPINSLLKSGSNYLSVWISQICSVSFSILLGLGTGTLIISFFDSHYYQFAISFLIAPMLIWVIGYFINKAQSEYNKITTIYAIGGMFVLTLFLLTFFYTSNKHKKVELKIDSKTYELIKDILSVGSGTDHGQSP